MQLGQPITIKPAGARHLRKEDGRVLSPDGETVIASSYWLRRLHAGDIVIVTAAKPAKTQES